MVLLLAAILVLAPLILTPSLSFYFDVTPKAAVALCGAAVLLPCVGASGMRGLRSTRAGRWFFLLLGATAVWAALSTVASVRPQLSLIGTNWRRFGLAAECAVLVAAGAAGEAAARGHIRTILRVTSCTGIPVAIYGILQYFGWDLLPTAPYHVGTGVWTIVRPPSTLGHAAYFANWTLFAVFSGIATWLTERTAWKVAGAASACAGSAAIVLSGTRAGIAGLGVGGALLWFWLRPRVSRRAVGVAAALAGLALVFYYSPAGLGLRSRARWYVEDAWGGARLRLWRDSLAMAVQHPVFGTGPETFSLVFPHYESKDLGAAYPDFYHESPHNIFLDAWAASGLPALAILGALCCVALYRAWRLRGREPYLSGALAAAVVASVVSHVFSVFTIPTALAFYVTLGLLAGLGTQAAQPPPRRVMIAATIPAALALALCGVWLTIADRRQVDVRAALGQGRIEDAINLAAHSPAPFDNLWYSRALAAAAARTPNTLLRLRFEQEALAAGLKATQVSENPQNAWYHVAMLRAAKNDFAGTEFSLREAIAASPNWFKPHWTLAQLLRMVGRTREARAEAVAAAQLNRKDPEVARTKAELGRD